MKIGFLGTGLIVQDFLQTINRFSFEKKYLLGTKRSIEHVEKIAQYGNFDQIFYDYDELLNTDVDTIYVALPNHLHYSFSKKAILAKKHVIIEKPITANLNELNDLIQCAKENHVMIFEAMTIHHSPTYKKLKEDINQLGDIKIVSLNYSQYSRRYDAFKNGETLPVFDPHKAGGALMDLNVYNIHFLVGLFGKPKQIQYLPNIEKGIDTSGILTLDYGSFKAIAIAAKDCKAPLLCTIQSDNGAIQIPSAVNAFQSYEIVSNDNQSREYKESDQSHRMYYEFNEFMQMIENQDYNQMEELLQISQIAMDIITTARKQTGIVFDNDMEEK